MSLDKIKILLNDEYNKYMSINSINYNTEIDTNTKYVEIFSSLFIDNLLNHFNNTDVFLSIYLFCKENNIENNFNFKNDNIKTLEKKTRNDYSFKKKVRDRDQKCRVCNNHGSYCEVAHIVDFGNKNSYDNEKYDSNNGLLLCPNIHTLFDKQDLKFIKKENNEYIIKINDKYNDDETLKQINNKKILFSNEEIYYLEKRYNTI